MSSTIKKFFNVEAFDFDANGGERQELVSMARTAEAAERYTDMCELMNRLVKLLSKRQESLTVEERNLLSVAYKNVIGTLRASWRTLSADATDANTRSSKIAKKFVRVVEQELRSVCNQVLGLLKETLLPQSSDGEEKVFYLKMAGDYFRYLAESIPHEAEHGQKASEYYDKAYSEATDDNRGLAPTHPIRLGLALNYSVCHYEILNNRQKACELARTAFEDAISQLDKLEESDYKDSTLIMQLLRDNLTLWTAKEPSGEGIVEVEDLSDEEN